MKGYWPQNIKEFVIYMLSNLFLKIWVEGNTVEAMEEVTTAAKVEEVS